MLIDSTSDIEPDELALRMTVDQVCEQFEHYCKSGSPPEIEDLLDNVSESGRSLLIRELVRLEVELQVRPKTKPMDYVARFPQYRPEIFEAWRKSGVPLLTRGDKIGDYEVRAVSGRGSFGIVYEAMHPKLKRVALKTSTVECPDRQLLDEAHVAGRLEHPAIVPIIDHGIDEQSGPFVVMPFYEGQTLRAEIDQGAMSIDRVMQVAESILQALSHSHRKGVIHKDLKPSNVLLDRSQNVAVCDFGLSAVESEDPIDNGMISGSPRYMSPEQIRGESAWLDGRTDIWSFGVILYEMLTGRAPFQQQRYEELSREILCREPKPLRQHVPGISRELELVCMKCLNKDLRDRYSTADDVWDALKQCGMRQHPATVQPSNRNPGKHIAIGMLVATVCFVIWKAIPDNTGSNEQSQAQLSSATDSAPEVSRIQDMAAAMNDFELRAFDGETEIFDHQLLRLPKNETLNLSVRPDKYDALVYLFSYQPGAVPDVIGGPVEVAAGVKSHVDELEGTVTGVTEYLLVLASTKRLTTEELQAMQIIPGEQSSQLRFRGLHSSGASKFAALLIPYLVEK